MDKQRTEEAGGGEGGRAGSLASRVHVISSDLFELPNTNTC